MLNPKKLNAAFSLTWDISQTKLQLFFFFFFFKMIKYPRIQQFPHWKSFIQMFMTTLPPKMTWSTLYTKLKMLNLSSKLKDDIFFPFPLKSKLPLIPSQWSMWVYMYFLSMFKLIKTTWGCSEQNRRFICLSETDPSILKMIVLLHLV